jgi:site-specific recombinase XerD
MRVFGWVEDFIKGYGETDYSKESGRRFLAEYLLQSNHSPTQFRTARTVVRRMDEILEDKLFTPCFRKPEQDIPTQFIDWIDKYFKHLSERGLKKSTIKGRRLYIGRLLHHLADAVPSFRVLAASDLCDVFTIREWPLTGLATVRKFLVYLFENGVTKTNLSSCVPNPSRPQTLPSVYSGDEVARLLSSVDRKTGMGKRDYAILMLAAHLGLRSSDIVGLSLRDIDHASKTITIVQVKTGRPQVLVMNRDVEESIVDYVENGRPSSSSDIIFLGSQAPYAPLSAGIGYAIAQRHFDRAGISPQGRRRGTHALRSSYATALVAKGMPYSVVRKALGHDDPESAKYYVRVDVRRLKACALNVPGPIGAFAVMLGDLKEVL